ncbi:hypothetical protein [Hymenobacter frigidus]|uniref:hypothetical protein n=1 Tax=Hymenobacter frigidus TaxID=1524095 RepID=UPI001669CBEC|nr:hypothetical protein [Hymenobacter frigidus]
MLCQLIVNPNDYLMHLDGSHTVVALLLLLPNRYISVVGRKEYAVCGPQHIE